MKHIMKFSTTSQYQEWKAANSGLSPYFCCCVDTGAKYYQELINNNGHEFVDLGLPSGTLWATMNIGASAVGQVGGYYAWGETSTKSDYSWETYAWGTEDALTKYNATDGKYCLDLEDDVAHVLWGGDWHIPSPAQIQELCAYTNFPSEGDYKGYQSTLNGEIIWLWEGGETNGEMDGTSIKGLTRGCFIFMSNSLSTNTPKAVQCFWDDGEGYSSVNPHEDPWTDIRSWGFQVRAVIGTLDNFDYPDSGGSIVMR